MGIMFSMLAINKPTTKLLFLLNLNCCIDDKNGIFNEYLIYLPDYVTIQVYHFKDITFDG